ncbi:MAG: hypothetical protein FJZ01_25060 [Candidatus Sericytochromatia bacterium]|nr:hypothetical protein [Candidatus Tanganyikabacteria bacterium]
MSRPFEACSRAEVLYLLDLVREHSGHVRLSYKEDKAGHLRILLETDSPQLTRYFGYMLDRERARLRQTPCESR